jgi:hypothetical protein
VVGLAVWIWEAVVVLADTLLELIIQLHQEHLILLLLVPVEPQW